MLQGHDTTLRQCSKSSVVVRQEQKRYGKKDLPAPGKGGIMGAMSTHRTRLEPVKLSTPMELPHSKRISYCVETRKAIKTSSV